MDVEIIAISVSIDYGDYLSQTLPNNRPLFSKFYIVTEERDTETCEIAKLNDSDILFTNKTKLGGATFNKSGMIYAAQTIVHEAHPNAWIVLLDADIYLPSDIWAHINVPTLVKNTLYGIARKTYSKYDNYLHNKPSSTYTCDVGIIGYFQMYFDKNKMYEKWSKNCSECDMTFLRAFGSTMEFKSIFASHFGFKGINWDGRKAAKWIANTV